MHSILLQYFTLLLVSSAKEVTFSSLFVCLSVCLSVSDFAQNLRTDLHEILSVGWQRASEQMVKFCCRSGSQIRIRIQIRIWIRIRIRIRIATLVRRALAEVYSVPVLLV